jgi:type IV pilus assembly protein PilK
MTAWSLASLPELSEAQLGQWLQLVEERTGIDFSQHQSILQTGLARRLRELGKSDCDAYFRQVQEVPEGLAEWQMLLAQLTVKETSFFRQPSAYDLVRAYLRKRLNAPHTEASQSLELWSVGCSSGEEPYSLAITANEAIAFSGKPAYFGVLATDICQQALAHGRAGIYGGRRLAGLSDSLRRRYFSTLPATAAEVSPTRAAEPSYQVLNSLRGRVCFSQGNLLHLERMPALPMDVIFCQNVLVYFRRWRVKQVMDVLADRLKPGGLLVVGPGEAANWQHPALQRTQHEGVTAWLRRAETSAAALTPPIPHPEAALNHAPSEHSTKG